MFYKSKKIFFLCSILALNLTCFSQQSKNKSDSLQTMLAGLGQDTSRVNTLNDIGYEYVNDAPDKTIKYSDEALKLAEELHYDYGIMCSHNNLGLAEYYKNNYEVALSHYAKAKVIAEKINNSARLSGILNNIGLVYDDKADYTKALEFYLKALKIADSVGGNKRLLASTLNNVGLIYKNLKKYDEALAYYTRSLKIKEEIGNIKGVGSSLHNIGLIYKLKGEYDKSLEYYSKALEIRRRVNDLSGTAMTLNNIGSLYDDLKEYEKAFPYYVEALKVRKDLKDNFNMCVSIYSLGENYYHRKKYAEGIGYVNQALEMATTFGAKDLIKYGYETLAKMYAEQKNYNKAYEYQKLFTEIKDSILNSETTKQLFEMQAKYENEKKQREIELLTKDSQIQALQLNKNKLWIIVLCIAILLVIALAALLYNRFKVKQKVNIQLEHRNVEITQQKKEITDSINYAKRIQESILPPVETWNRFLPDSFIFYRPKDIVSGDFYWIEQKNEFVCFAAVDCTGHGVPGALMSVVGFNLLTQAINEVNLLKPSEILKHLDAGVTKTLRQSEDGKGVKDGMDLSLCTLNTKTLELQYAGAFNSLYHVSDGVLTEIKADKFPIGVNLDGIVDNYRNHTIQLKKGDSIYLYSDGYADQFGGPKGKKFKYNQLKEMLASICQHPVTEQKKLIESRFDAWKGGLEQIDDVVIIGVRV
jgi:serine phosphatase RsbU (regulator of sigma subunit)